MFLEQIKADPRFAQLKQSIYSTWNSIAPDCEDYDSLEAVEACIDADRLITFAGDKQSDDFIKELHQKVSWNRLLKFLAKEVGI